MMLGERDEREKDAQYDEWHGEFSEFIANETQIIGKVFHRLLCIMHKEACDEEEHAHME